MHMQPAVRSVGAMARFLIERTFADDVDIKAAMSGLETCLAIVDRNAELGVTWVHSYVSTNQHKAYCIYDGPDVESLRRAAVRNGLPVEAITRVRILSPYLYL